MQLETTSTKVEGNYSVKREALEKLFDGSESIVAAVGNERGCVEKCSFLNGLVMDAFKYRCTSKSLGVGYY